MRLDIENAIYELEKHGITFDISVKKFIKSNKTLLNEGIFYYESVPKALVYLKSLELGSEIIIESDFKTFGSMIDLSRGAVLKVSYLKELIRKEALLGVNEIWLYLEDVYPIEGQPCFGYLRGKYSKEELKELVAYANIFGIELVPSIQTLGHMEQYLKWPNVLSMQDQEDILMPLADKTYDLIEKMLKFCKEVFKTNKIHVGMDETFGLGFGNFYKKNGFKPPYEIFFEHLEKVYELSMNAGFDEVLIWSDMFFRLFSERNEYYDINSEVDLSVMSKIPEKVTLVYWDYYNHNYDIVYGMLKKHKEMNRKIVMASGTWVWTRFTYDKYQTDRTALKHIEACKALGIDEIIFTQWQDDGAYVDFDTVMLGMYDMAKSVISNDIPNQLYEYLQKETYSDALIRTSVNTLKMNLQGITWDDPLLGIFINNEVGYDYQKLDSYIEEYKILLDKLNDKNHKHIKLLVEVGYLKMISRREMLFRYQSKEKMPNIIAIQEKIINVLEALINSFDEMWMNRNKIYGLEIIEVRLAGQIQRAKTVISLVKAYNKEYRQLDFLEEDVVTNQYLSLKYMGLATSTKPR